MKRTSKKGFTLAELLIVVAIIGILLAIMFPVFGAQLEKARLAADLSNLRADYSEKVADAMLDEAFSSTTNSSVAGATPITVTLDKTVMVYKSTAKYDKNAKTVTVSRTSGSNTISGSFKVDADVTVQGLN